MAIEIVYTHSDGVKVTHIDKEGWRASIELSWEEVEELCRQREIQKGK